MLGACYSLRCRSQRSPRPPRRSGVAFRLEETPRQAGGGVARWAPVVGSAPQRSVRHQQLPHDRRLTSPAQRGASPSHRERLWQLHEFERHDRE